MSLQLGKIDTFREKKWLHQKMGFFQIFLSFSLEIIVETLILSLFWTHQNICYVLLFVYVSFAYLLACIDFLHMMFSFGKVL